MLLTADMGNTNITLGAYKDDALVFESRLATARSRTCDQYAIELLDIFRLHNTCASDYSGSILCSVVPELTNILSEAMEKATGKKTLVLSEKVKTGLEVAIDTPSQIGADLIAASVGAKLKYAMPCFIVDLGTATKIIALNSDGAFCGCTISPGMGISLNALSATASQLPYISFSAPSKAIGTDTVECMQSGIIYGTAAMLDGLMQRISEELGYGRVSVAVTGGYGGFVVPHCKTRAVYDSTLILDGLREIYNMNESR